MQLDTEVKSQDLIFSKEVLKISRNGYFLLNYGNNYMDKENNLSFISEIYIEKGIIFIKLNIQYDFNSRCGRCLRVEYQKDNQTLDTSVNLNLDNDYEINYNQPFYDLAPFISELIIEKMNNNFICDSNCKGLCTHCGVDLNLEKCNHEEKNLKESPFSSLSQLDL